jgi:hypothetical protein
VAIVEPTGILPFHSSFLNAICASCSQNRLLKFAGKLDPKIANELGYLGASYLRALEVSEIETCLFAPTGQQ